MRARSLFEDRWVLVVVLTAVIWAFLPDAARADLFWVGGANGSRIGRADNAGGEVNRSFIGGLRNVGTVAVGAGNLYWTSGARIGRAALSGAAVNPGFIRHLGPLNGVAVTARYLYWLSPRDPGCGGKPGFGRSRLNGSGVDRGFVCSGEGEPTIADSRFANGIGVEGHDLFWSWIRGIGRLDVERRSVVNRFIVLPRGYTAAGITASGAYIYWGSYNLGPVIGRAKRDGESPDPAFISGLAGNIAPEVAAVDHHLYFANDYGSNATIARAGLTGIVSWDFITGFEVVGDLTAT